MIIIIKWIFKYVYFNFLGHNRKLPQTKIITYHDVSKNFRFDDYTVSLKSFRKHVSILSEMGYDIISFENLDKTTSENFIVFTFDDGLKGIIDAAIVLKEFGHTATFFITTSLIGRDGYIGWNEVVLLRKLGFEIASHSHNHVPISSLNLDYSLIEMTKSKQILEDYLKEEVKLFAFPYGQRSSFNDENIDQLKFCGYKKVFTQIPVHQNRSRLKSNFILGRVGIKSYYNLRMIRTFVR